MNEKDATTKSKDENTLRSVFADSRLFEAHAELERRETARVQRQENIHDTASGCEQMIIAVVSVILLFFWIMCFVFYVVPEMTVF